MNIRPLRVAGCVSLRMAAAAAAAVPAVQLGVPPAGGAALDGIDAERDRAHVELLADDLLGSRARGSELAAQCLAAQSPYLS